MGEDARSAQIDGPAAEMFAADVASSGLDIELVSVGDGTATARMRATAAMVNGHGIVHGGYLFLLADTAFACACNSHGQATVAAGAEITYVAKVYAGEELYACAAERTRFGRNGLYDVTIRRGAGSDAPVVAEFRGHSRTLSENPGPNGAA